MKRTRGLTLTEAMVAGALAIFLGLVMLKLVGSGLGAHSKGAQTRDAQAGVRNVLSLLVAELRSATVPPLSEPMVVTPVFWPGVWGAEQEATSTDSFYPREETAVEGGVEIDTATNRLVYVRTSESEPDPAAGPLDHFALVELLVPKNRPGVVERRIHPITSLNGLLTKGSVEGADGAQRQAWLLDFGALAALEPPADPDILYDAGADARVAFRVGHRTFEPASDPGRTRNPQLFEPGVFKVEVAVAIKPREEGAEVAPWPQAETWATLREETTELRIPAVRQN